MSRLLVGCGEARGGGWQGDGFGKAMPCREGCPSIRHEATIAYVQVGKGSEAQADGSQRME